MEILCRRLKELRKEEDLTQEELGKVIGVKRGAISYYESGARMPSVEYLSIISDRYNKSMDYFVGRDYYVVSDNREEYGRRVSFSREEIKFIMEIRRDNRLYSQLLDNPENLVSRMKIRL